ncbi:type VI secretion system Vgr family protein [Dechloromonas denitrificans]|uniref:type VI secretion system Vgr family protein n=1 Tax=Dechloromonas denitrificans TaxID=281362 RepID=UPI001CFAF9A5|nr:type VI secretion system Vgr family protein [Dechloromonas denitrificans]UCV06333.1 type VI secretion system tip protein VgrG [Dechloromonas denitrificans]
MNNILDLISGAGWGQNARLLTLTTPAGPDALLAETARIDEALGPVAEHAGFRIELTVLAANAEQSLTALLGQPARLDLQTSQSRTTLRPFHGHITDVARLGANGGFARYRLIIEPWLSFLGHNRDHYLFQDKSLIEIVDELLGDWKSQGKLSPDWRWDLADVAAYPKRGMTVQYQETDLAFLKRLLAEEGLFCWFEHESGSGESLGQHRLVIADHNGAFKDNAQPRIRYTQAGATLSEDSLDRWHGLRQIDTAEINASSWDYRSLSPRPQSAGSAIANGTVPRTVAWHDPGQYAWQNSAHGERMQGNQRQAIDARLKQYQGEGTVRTGAPGTTFSLAEHPEHDLDAPEQRQFLITAISHRARNNLGESIPELIDSLGPVADDNEIPFAQPTDFYRNRLSAIRTSIAWRPEGRHISGRPTGNGTLTAIVVGAGQPTHTDRDGRVRVQFPWQRGGQSAARQAHPTGADNAPASDTLGVWLRVMAPVAGSNWGGHLTPRPGQEVVVAFQNGNIDRPVIVGSVYNGQGSADAQGNQIGSGTMQASANAPAFFAGQDAAPHTHNASLSGLKSQQLTSSQSGQGGYNQLVFDDTPGESRIELGTTEHLSHLQLGHLKQQSDNARQADRGHGGELATQAATAIRAGNGLLLSTDARPGACSTQLDSREPISQSETAQSLSHSLADVAAKQNAALKGDPAADQLPAVDALKHAGEVMRATTTHGAQAASGSDIKATQGGTGSVPAWSEPRIQYAAPGGIAQLTPKNHLLVAGKSLSIASNQDTNLIAQGNHSLATKDGIALFTVGKANSSKPNSETGIHLHAASGQVSLQSQSGKTTAAADKKVTIASTTASLTASAKQKIIATAQGAYLKIEGGDISVHAPGKVEFKGSQKNLTGPKSASGESINLPKTGELLLSQKELGEANSIQFLLNGPNGKPMANYQYEITDSNGSVVTSGRTDGDGKTVRFFTKGEVEGYDLHAVDDIFAADLIKPTPREY